MHRLSEARAPLERGGGGPARVLRRRLCDGEDFFFLPECWKPLVFVCVGVGGGVSGGVAPAKVTDVSRLRRRSLVLFACLSGMKHLD